METNWTKMIEQYLTGELNTAQRAEFEQELAQSEALRNELELHKITHQIIERATLRELVKQGGKTYLRLRQLKISALILAVLLVVGAGIFYAVKSKSNAKPAPIESIDEHVLKSMQTFLEFDNIAPEYFGFTGESDVFLSENGVLLSVTDASFLQDGKPYSGPAVIQWQEAQEAADIVKAGLSTMSGDKLLETQGMFSLKAFTPAGKPLDLSNSGVYVQVPVNENKEGMQLFQGIKGKDGQIDWQNPKPLERLPQAKAMQEMDLFPPDYEPKLNELKWFKEKEKRDSLYLSFDEEISPVENDTIGIVEDILFLGNNVKQWTQAVTQSVGRALKVEYPEDKAKWNFSIEQAKGKTYVVARVQIEKSWHINSLYLPNGSFGYPTSFRVMPNKAYKLIGKPIEPQPIEMHDELANEDLKYHEGFIVLRQEIKPLTSGKIPIQVKYAFQPCDATHCLPPFEGRYGLVMNGKSETSSHIPPSKVLAIWRPKFDGTILATRDFEKRMQAIHRTCNKKVFEVYTSNLNEPLWQKDERVAKMGYPEFKAFAAERVGAMKINDKHARNLAAFYASMTEILRNKGKREVEAALAKERKWDEQLMHSRNKEIVRQGLRFNANLNDEANFNLKNISKQFGRKVGFQLKRTTFLAPNGIVPKIKKNGAIIVNLDRLTKVFLSSRQSATIKDNKSDKTVTISYREFQVEVNNATEFDKLYFYLLPKELNSYQRLNFGNGKLNYSLNEAVQYSAVAFGMNENGFFLYDFNEFKGESASNIDLKPVSEADLNKILTERSHVSENKAYSMQKELAWLFVEKQNYQVMKQRNSNAKFRQDVEPSVFPCLKDDGAAVTDSIGGNNTMPKILNEYNSIVDVPASFVTGNAAFRTFLNDNIVYPERAMNDNIQGKVYLNLYVDNTGQITDVKLKKGLPNCSECDAEAIRVARLIGKMNPGMLAGNAVNSIFMLPVTFKIY